MARGTASNTTGRRRLVDLRDALRALRDGDASVRLPVDGSDPALREVCLAFNQTAAGAAENVQSLREEFLSIASHELRTPITTLKLQMQALERDLHAEGSPQSELVDRRLLRAARQTDRLADLIDEVLDVSLIAAGDLALSTERFDLNEVVLQVAGRFTNLAAETETELLVMTSVPFEGTWDRMRIDQVLTNLIANALRYGRGHPVEVEVKKRGRRVRVSVRDRGIGVKARDRERIFERFVRAVPSRNYGGLGLGLYVVRQIVEAHGGRVHVVRSSGEGATFVVDLPAQVEG